jgi:NADH-quinone oxidoreductase subunit L
LFEYSDTILSLILIIGGTTAFFTGLLAVVQNDIKRVIAYSTLSQLGYMAVALGASAYNAAIFHLVTHAFFKALLFLGAGSVIIAMHHEQDMRKMGGLAKYLPITYITFVIGTLALCAIPPFSGFYSKDTIIEAVQQSQMIGANYAYWCVLLGAFVTPLYSFRALFMTFHTKPRMDEETRSHLHEGSWVVWVPLVLLAIPSVMAGQVLINKMLYASPTLLANSVFVLPEHNVMAHLAEEFHGAAHMALEAGASPTLWLTLAGILTAWLFTSYRPALSAWITRRFSLLYTILVRKYGFDDFNQIVLVHGTQDAGHLFYEVSDVKLIDGVCVNGSGSAVRWVAKVARNVQTGYLYHYALAMVLGIVVFLIYFMWG